MIEFYCQAGCPQSDVAFTDSYARLLRAFAPMEAVQCSSLVDSASIVLRISGDIWKFSGRGCEKLRLQRKKRYVTIDLVVPENVWRQGIEVIDPFVVQQVTQACTMFSNRLEREDSSFDRVTFDREYTAALDRYRIEVGNDS